MIELINISKAYKDVVIDNFSYTFLDNHKYLLKGQCGTGKTTLLNIIANLEKVYTGTITTSNSISYCFQQAILLDNYNPVDNIKIFTKKNKETIIKDLSLFLDEKSLSTKCKKLSGGQRQIVNVVMALLADSDCVLIDEPFNNLNEDLYQKLFDYINDNLQSRTLIMVSHIINPLDFSNYTILDCDSILR